MAGIGFELRKAMRSGRGIEKSGGYFSAAFTCFGGMLIGIILLAMVQAAAGAAEIEHSVCVLFMSYTTNTMFFSMLVCAALSLVLSRYVSDMIYEERYEAVMPSLIGGGLLAMLGGGALFSAFVGVSAVPLARACLLLLLFEVLTLCWMLMNYISLLRDYRQIVFAFLLALAIAGVLMIVIWLFGLMSMESMLIVLLAAYVVVDAWLFRAVYLGFPVEEGGIFRFLPWVKRHIPLIVTGLMTEVGLLGHFWITWYASSEGIRLQGLFGCSLTYDFPAIVAYFCTIPSMVYFITMFETDFYEKYHAYLMRLNGEGRSADVNSARENMIDSIRGGMRNLAAIQIISCLLCITIGAKLLSVMNIGMTEKMLESFRFFCVGYSLYAIGNVLMLLQMYFVNERRAMASATLFALLVLALTWADIALLGQSSGLGLSVGSLALVIAALIQLIRCLDGLEYHILCESGDGAPIAGVGPTRTGDWLIRMQPVRRRVLAAAVAAVCLVLTVVSSGSLMKGAMDDSKRLVFHPVQSEKVLLSPGIGFAPWANSDEAEQMRTTLVYVELRWADWEPNKGEYDIDFVNEEYRLETYRAQGRQVVFRFLCDNPTDRDHIDIPDWLYNETQDGQHYDTSYGMGYSPNYGNETLIQAHARAIAALGEAFGGDDFFRFVELGSLGHWGEYHVNVSEGVPALPIYDVRLEYITPYLAAFPNAHFMTRYPLLETQKFGFGLYNDMTGEPEETEYWIEQMSGGVWEQTGLPEQADCRDAWKTAPVGGEFASLQSDSFYLHDNLSTTLEMLRASHQSFIGPKIIVNETEVDYTSSANAILRTIGYRFGVSQVEVDLSGETQIGLRVTLFNSGNAPIYEDYDIRLTLYDDEENEVWSASVSDVSLSGILPGASADIAAEVSREELDDDTRYRLTVSIVNDQEEPYIPMALAAEDESLEYVLADFMVGR